MSYPRGIVRGEFLQRDGCAVMTVLSWSWRVGCGEMAMANCLLRVVLDPFQSPLDQCTVGAFRISWKGQSGVKEAKVA